MRNAIKMRLSVQQLCQAAIFNIVAFFIVAQAASAIDAASLFSQKCAGCHTVGGGSSVGPDLAPTKKWDSSNLHTAVKGMEKNAGPLSDEEVDALVQYLKNASSAAVKKDGVIGQSASTLTPVTPPPEQKQAEPGSPQRGRNLFFGEEPLKNGGLSCIACHSAGKGSMGPELASISSKMTEVALVAACEHTPYKVMKDAYRDHPVTRQEAIDIGKYLFNLKDHPERQTHFPWHLAALLVAGCVVAAIAYGYRNRKTGARQKLQRRKRS